MATTCGTNKLQGHPCFGGNQQKNGRIHLPVAPRCNIKCGYCSRKHDCVNESRPGLASRILLPAEALELVRGVMADERLGAIIKVVGIAGPGEPLANAETFETFRLVAATFPQLLLCLSSNGLLLPEKIEQLHQIGLSSLTVTLNALDPIIGGQIYSHISWHGRPYHGPAGAEILIANQLAGIERAVALGLTVKVNTVLIPGINDSQIEAIARKVKELGAFVMNVMPLIPQSELAHLEAPSPTYLEEMRGRSARIIGQFSHCRQCRADAIGLIGQDEPLAGRGCFLPTLAS